MVYYFSDLEQLDNDTLNRLIDNLPVERKKRALKYRFENGKKSCTIAYYLFLLGYRALGHSDTPDFDIKDGGKPFIKEHPEINFNISHCNNVIACIFNDNPVGIDVECKRKISDSLINKVCSAKEKEEILSADDKELSFCRLWTIKEAIVKLSGDGLVSDITTINNDGLFTHSIKLDNNSYMTIAAYNSLEIDTRKINLKEVLTLL